MPTYFISDGQLVKIGKSNTPQKRLAQLQTSHHSILTLLLVMDGEYERDLHQQFADDHHRGEWFIFSPAIRAFIDDYVHPPTPVQPPAQSIAYVSSPEGLAEAQHAAEIALRVFPTLNANGFAVLHRRGRPDPNYPLFSHPLSALELATAIGFLRKCSHSNTQRQGSYGLKHVAENWGEVYDLFSYVSNGKLIAAAAYLDFPIKPDGPDSPNASIGISTRGVDDVRLDIRNKQIAAESLRRMA